MTLNWLKGKIKCEDCGKEIKIIAPNQKRCKKCHDLMAIKRGCEWMALHSEFNRQNAKRYYWNKKNETRM